MFKKQYIILCFVNSILIGADLPTGERLVNLVARGVYNYGRDYRTVSFFISKLTAPDFALKVDKNRLGLSTKESIGFDKTLLEFAQYLANGSAGYIDERLLNRAKELRVVLR